jgi:hypothetical protein
MFFTCGRQHIIWYLHDPTEPCDCLRLAVQSLAPAHRVPLVRAFDRMITELTDLNTQWMTQFGNQPDVLRKYVLPSDLETGAGY